MLRAEEAIGDYAHYSERVIYSYDSTMNSEGHSSAHFARLAGQARDTALTRLSRLTDAQALTVIAGTRLHDLDGSSFPIAGIEDVQKRRAHLVNMDNYHLAGERILKRMRAKHDPRPHARRVIAQRRATP